MWFATFLRIVLCFLGWREKQEFCFPYEEHNFLGKEFKFWWHFPEERLEYSQLHLSLFAFLEFQILKIAMWGKRFFKNSVKNILTISYSESNVCFANSVHSIAFCGAISAYQFVLCASQQYANPSPMKFHMNNAPHFKQHCCQFLKPQGSAGNAFEPELCFNQEIKQSRTQKNSRYSVPLDFCWVLWKSLPE